MDPTRRLKGEETERLARAPTWRARNVSGEGLLPSLGRLSDRALIADRYRPLDELSQRGGEADAYRCRDEETGDIVVVKIYRANLQPKKQVLDQLKGLRHEDLVALLDYGTWQGRFFEVMEYATGGTLADHAPHTEEHLRREVLPQVLEGLHFLHEKGIIHRDVKPTNLFYRDKERRDVVLGDFGISSVVGGEVSLRYTTSPKRTVEFAAPELFTNIFGREVDYYALGVTLVCLLAGRSPFQDMTEQQIMHTHLTGRMHPPAGCSPGFRTLLAGLLHKQREKRWGYQQVRRWLDGEEVPVEPETFLYRGFRYTLDEGLEAHSPQELGQLLFEYPDLAKRHIKTGILRDGLAKLDQALALRVSETVERARTQEEAYAEIVYTLNPQLPYRLLPGLEARSPRELARLIDSGDEAWAAGREQLFNGSISTWLRATGHTDLAAAWEREAGRFGKGR